MPKWKKRSYRTRYLANINPSGDKEFHDLKNEQPQCQIDKIIKHCHDKEYEHKFQAKKDVFDPCAWYMPGESTR